MNKKAILCLILAFALIFSGCNGGDNTETTGNQPDFVFETSTIQDCFGSGGLSGVNMRNNTNVA